MPASARSPRAWSKAGADLITISGHDGGTGASPLRSIRYAGVPWELGLSEAHQALHHNGLRARVLLQADGGLKTGLDVVKAALLGADSFGFGTAPMIALGCKYLRICHLNNCATGVATQDDAPARASFHRPAGTRGDAFSAYVAEDVREWLARLGVRTLGEIIGRTELLRAVARCDANRRRHRPVAHCCGANRGSDTRRTAARAALAGTAGRPRRAHSTPTAPMPIDARRAAATSRYAIRNTDRSIGARLSGAIARQHGNNGMARGADHAAASTAPPGRASARSTPAACTWNWKAKPTTTSARAWPAAASCCARRAMRASPRATAPILGNTCLYGATGGELYAAGRAGERFAVRNSGALAVVEGAGDHCCEYMTGGVVVVLGRTGLNFGAGFTGGLAYVLDLDRDFVDRYNHELIDILRVSPEGFDNYRQHLHDLVRHAREADRQRLERAQIIDEFRDFIGKFWLVKPKAASLEALATDLRRAA